MLSIWLYEYFQVPVCMHVAWVCMHVNILFRHQRYWYIWRESEKHILWPDFQFIKCHHASPILMLLGKSRECPQACQWNASCWHWHHLLFWARPWKVCRTCPATWQILANSQLWGELCCLLEGCWRLCLLLCWWLVVTQFYIWLDALSWARAPAKQKAAQWMHPAWNETTKSLQMANKYIYSLQYRHQRAKGQKPTFLAYMPPN